MRTMEQYKTVWWIGSVNVSIRDLSRLEMLGVSRMYYCLNLRAMKGLKQKTNAFIWHGYVYLTLPLLLKAKIQDRPLLCLFFCKERNVVAEKTTWRTFRPLFSSVPALATVNTRMASSQQWRGWLWRLYGMLQWSWPISPLCKFSQALWSVLQP